MRATKVLLCHLVGFLILSFFISSVNARTETFRFETEQEITKSVSLRSSESVCGNISVQGGVIDFFVTEPEGDIILYHGETTFTDFNFSAPKDGNYTMHFVSPLRSPNITLTVNYGINFLVTLQQNIGISLGVASVVSTSPPPFPLGRPKKPNLGDYIRIYVNIRESTKILNLIDGIWYCFPIGKVLIPTAFILFVVAVLVCCNNQHSMRK